MPRVSIIMGAYNCADVVGNAIESIQNQTFEDWEFIICDDCSKDNTYKVVKTYADNDSRIILIQNEKNCHLAYTLNHCLSMAKCEYVARMDADDISQPYRLAEQVAFLDAHPEYSVVGCGVTLYDDSGDRQILFNKEEPVVKDMIYGVPFFHPTIMMRRAVYQALGGYVVSERTRRGQDLDLWFRFFAKGYKGYNIHEPLLKYHDDLNDYGKKNSFKMAWGTTQTLFLGFRANHFPLYYYFWTLVPIITACMPRPIVYYIHKKHAR